MSFGGADGFAGLILAIHLDELLHFIEDGGHDDLASGRELAAGFFLKIHGKAHQNPPGLGIDSGEKRQSRSKLAEVHERYRMNGIQVISNPLSVLYTNPRIARSKFHHIRIDASRIGDRSANKPAVHEGAKRKAFKALPDLHEEHSQLVLRRKKRERIAPTTMQESATLNMG